MNAHIELIMGIIRVGENFNKFGDPYEFSASVVILGEEAIIMGAGGKGSMKTLSAIKKELKKHGINKIIWDRKKTNKHVEIKT